jgi:outer membrane protein OmpA-like peptidoglycan-associated protein
MIGLRLAVFLSFLGPVLCGFGLCFSARAQDAPLRAEIEVNTTVLDELEGYKPPPMFGTPDRPVLSRPIERLALPSRGTPSGTQSLKKKAENSGLRLARPIIEDMTRSASVFPKAPSVARLAGGKPEAEKNRNNRIAIPIPAPKPHTTTPESPKIAAAAPVPPPPPRRRSQVTPVSLQTSGSGIVKSTPKKPQTASLSRATAKAEEKAGASHPVRSPVETSVENPALMPAMPTPVVMRQALATGQNAMLPRAPAAPVSGEVLLSAPETPLPTAAAAEALAVFEPAAGGHDITAYEAPEASAVSVSADISAGPAFKRSTSPKASKTKDPVPDGKRAVFEEASLTFRKGQSDLEPSQTGDLKTRVSTALVHNPRARIQILSFASAADGSQSSARRVSLLRALSVRGWLVSRGIAPSRIDVRALGEGAKDGSPDRIDLVVFDPARRP